MDGCVAETRPIGGPSEDESHHKAEVRQFADRDTCASEHDRRR
jgi:hypothetical protein